MTLSLLFSTSFIIHDYHVSMMSITHNTELKTFDIEYKIFTDDLEMGVKQDLATSLFLNTEDETDNSDEYIKQYLTDNVIFSLNGKPIKANYIGKEYEEDITWIYLQIEKVKKVKSFSISNSVLFNTFDDQKNILNLEINSTTKGKILRKEDSEYNYVQ